MEGIDYGKLNYLGLMPCPMKISMEQLILGKIKELESKYGTKLRCYLASNAVMQEDIFEDISKKETIEELPDIMLAPGIGKFFYKDFKVRFRDRGVFSCIENISMSKDYESLKLHDPKGYYHMVGFNPLVFLYDSSVEKNIEEPYFWSDLTKECYQGKIAYRGRDDRSFCEGVLLSVYTELGEEGIKKLGKSVKCRLHPAEMVKLAGSKKKEAPLISVIPLSFAKLVRINENVKIIWPKDGAAINPLVMLVKARAEEVVKELAAFIMGEEMKQLFEQVGFYPLEGIVQKGPLQEKAEKQREYKWCGWEFIESHSMFELLQHLNQIMYQAIHEERESV